MPNYIYRTAEKLDNGRVLKFLADHFYHEEPNIKATGEPLSVWLPILAEMVESSLQFPLSTIVTTEDGDTVVACLLNSVWKREGDQGAEHSLDGFSDVMQRFYQRPGIHGRPEKNTDELSEPKYSSNELPFEFSKSENKLEKKKDNSELTKAEQWIGEKEHWERIEINPGETAIIPANWNENILRIHCIHHIKYTCI
uniref:Acetyltransferase n=1 Tax=Caenorhabditis tropicalis TaxID=1561998 RepID=A0A1I7T3T8_9PELO